MKRYPEWGDMIRPGEHELHSPVNPANAPVSIEERWTALYGSQVAEQLRRSGRYSLIRVGDAEFAYTAYDRCLRALGQAWEAGFVPEPLPTAVGRDLVDVAPNLQGVDLNLADLGARPT